MASVFGEMIVKKRLGASDLKFNRWRIVSMTSCIDTTAIKVENFFGRAYKLVFWKLIVIYWQILTKFDEKTADRPSEAREETKAAGGGGGPKGLRSRRR